MPNGGFVASSKLLQKKWEERAYQMHRQKMMSMKSDLSEYNSPKSHSFPHLVLRVKKIQKEEERQAQIDYENQLLIQKMTKIMKSQGTIDNKNNYEPRSLNILKREREQERIAEENLEFAKRLEQVKPKYDVHDWEEEFQKHSYYLNMWAHSTKDYSPRPQRKKTKAGSLNQSKSSVDNTQEDYDSDFETDEEHDSEHEKLPKIESQQNSYRENNQKKKKDSKVTKLPNISNKKTEARKLNRSKDSRGREKNPAAESDAKLLFKATKKLANADEVIMKTLVKKSHAQRMATKEKFEELYDTSLEEELKGLGKDYQVLAECLLAKRESRDAEAVNIFIHDNDVSSLINLFCSRNQSALNSINSSYQEKFDVSIKDDLGHRILSDDCQELLLALLESSKAKDDVDEAQAKEDAQTLYEAGTGRFTERDGKMLELLRTRSLPQIKAILNKYKSVSGGEDITESMKNEGCSKEFINAVQTMIKCMNNGAALNAEKIHSLIKSGKKTELIHLLMARAEIDMPEVNKTYRTKYGKDLSGDISDKFGKPLGPLMAQFTNKPGRSDQSKGLKAQNKSQGKSAPTRSSPAKKSPERRPDTKKDTKTKSVTKTDQNKQTEQDKKVDDAERKKDTKSSRGSEVDKEKDNKSRRGSEMDKSKDARSSKSSEDNKRKDNKSTRGSVREAKNFNPEDDAEKIHEAVKGFGTDEQPLIDILAYRSNAQRQQIRSKYQDKYEKDLIDVMKSELTGDFEEVTLALLMTPTAYDVYCLHDAIHGPGTREAALIGILCARTNEELSVIKDEYKKLYENSLEDDLRGDTSGDFEDMLIELSKGEREQGNTVNKEKAEEDADTIHKAGDLAEVHDLFRNVLCKKNKAQVKATFEQYKKISGQTIEEAIKNANWENKNDTVEGYISLVEAIQDPVCFYAKRLQDAVDGFGTNDKQLIRIIVSRSETDLADIAAKFKEITGKSLEETIEDETSGDYKNMLLAIVKDK